jgi:outer membrane receptor protein involved in Fe transport
VLAAMETIEIVKGPPSPIYGMGKIGGYTNMVPRSVRAATGGYLLEPQGFVQAIHGSYEKSEVSFGVGGPLPLATRQGGYYIYGLLEDSGSFVEHVPIEQRVLQAAVTVDKFAGRFRLETGINLQRSTTAGALMGRFTQDVADSGRYIRGEPLVNLDVNANQRIGYREMYERSPVQGEQNLWNRPLVQSWPWPVGSDGEPLMLENFPTVPGIPESLFNYLNEHPESDPDGLLRAQGIGGPLPLSGYVPAGFALDPASVSFDTLDLRRAGAFERELQADFVIAYLDLVYDENPNFTIKNQLFFDSMEQYKLSEQPFSQIQDVYVLEDKLTLTRRLTETAGRVDVNALASVNLRYTSSRGFVASGDYGTHRTDAMSGDGLLMPNSTFATALLNERLDDDGMPWTGHYATDAWELGVGALFDIEVADRTSLIIGGRIDRSKAGNTDYAGTLDLAARTSSDPAGFLGEDRRASGYDTGVSWSVSVSHELLRGVRPYLTVGRTSLALDRNNNRYSNDVIEAGHIGSARLAELGLKTHLLGGKLFLSMAAYEQARLDASVDDVRSVINAHVSSTLTRGWEAEFKWVPSGKLLLSLYALRQETQYRPNVGAAVMVDARALGFQDVTDADGNVVYPAEAFLYGGRAFIALPPDLAAYEDKQGNPDTQFGITARYEFSAGFGFSLSGNYFSGVSAGRLHLVELPAAYVANAGLFWSKGNVEVKYDVLNLLDERYFRARSGDTLGDTLVSAMPGRHWQASVKLRF